MPPFIPVFFVALIALSCLFKTNPAAAFEVKKNYYDLSDQFEFLVDNSGELTIEQLLDNPSAYRFSSSSSAKPAPEIVETAIWLKVTLVFPEQKKNSRYVISTLTANFSDIRIYRPTANGLYSEFITGNTYPASMRETGSTRYSFTIDPSVRTQTIYLRTVGGLNTFRLPWVLLDKQTYDKSSYIFWTINLISIGALLGIFVFNVGIGSTLQNRNYLFYSSYILLGTLSLSNIDGFAFYILWPNLPGFNYYAADILTVSISITRLLTILSFFDTKKMAPRLYWIAKTWLWILAVFFVLACATSLKPISNLLGGILWAISMLLGFVISAYAIRKKATLAIPIFIVLLIPAVGSVTQGLAELGFIDAGIVLLQVAKIAFVLHALLFSICLALHIKHEVNSRIIAQHDGLTGLPSLLLATDRFSKAAVNAQRYQWKLAILFIDLDGFKAVNDTYGHDMGNKLLIEVAKRINDCVRDVDTLARIGGDEFLVIQTEVKEDSAVTKVAEKIISALSSPFVIDNIDIHIGASIGISEYPDHGNDLNHLIILADNAMYSIKKSGKNNYCLHPS